MRRTDNRVADALLWLALLASLAAACDAIERAGAQSAGVPASARHNAQPGPGPAAQSPRAWRALALDLARCGVGEAGWKPDDDEHTSIWWVVRKRFTQAVKRWPGLLPRHVLWGYCKALSGDRQWLRELSLVGMPAHWPQHRADWPRHRSLWLRVVERAQRFVLGQLPDPCPAAMHWGGPPGVDKPCDGCVLVDCGTTRNRFYRVRGKR